MYRWGFPEHVASALVILEVHQRPRPVDSASVGPSGRSRQKQIKQTATRKADYLSKRCIYRRPSCCSSEILHLTKL